MMSPQYIKQRLNEKGFDTKELKSSYDTETKVMTLDYPVAKQTREMKKAISAITGLPTCYIYYKEEVANGGPF